MLLSREDVEPLERRLFQLDAEKRAAEAALRSAQREHSMETDRLREELRVLRRTSEAAGPEVQLLQRQVDDLLAERSDLVENIDWMELEVASLRRQVTNAAACRRDPYAVVKLQQPAPSAPLTDVLHASGSEISGGGTTVAEMRHGREEALLALLDKGAASFAILEQELRAANDALAALQQEKVRWAAAEFDYLGVIDQLQQERERYITMTLERNASVIVATQAVMHEEAHDRKLLEAMADATLFRAAYMRCRDDVAMISMQFDRRVACLAVEHQEELRQREAAHQLTLDRMEGRHRELREADMRESERRFEELILAKQKVEIQNQLLRTNCEEWRGQGAQRDQRHHAELERLRRDAAMQLQSRDKLIASRDDTIATLSRERDDLSLSCSELQRRLEDQIKGMRERLEEEHRRRRSLVCSETQTNSSAYVPPEVLRKTITQEVLQEHAQHFESHVRAHPLFTQLERRVSLMDEELDASRKSASLLRQQISAAEGASDTAQQAWGAERRQLKEQLIQLEEAARSAQQREGLAARQRDALSDEAAAAATRLEALQKELTRVTRLWRQLSDERADWERQLESADSNRVTLTAQLGAELKASSELQAQLSASNDLIRGWRVMGERAQLSAFASEESVERQRIASAHDAVFNKLSMMFLMVIAAAEESADEADDDEVAGESKDGQF